MPSFPAKAAASLNPRSSKARSSAVSYTHLDVYKRQALYRSQGSRRAGRRHRAHADGELRAQALRQRHRGEFQVRRREATGGAGLPARLPARAQGDDPASQRSGRDDHEARRRRQEGGRARAPAHGHQGQRDHARGQGRRPGSGLVSPARRVDRPDRPGRDVQG